MKKTLPFFALALFATAGSALAAGSLADYPTSDRVVFVQDCVRDHPGPHFEMINKCSCALDTIAKDVPYDQFVTMSTATNANSIGGERGSYIRDVDLLQKEIRKFRSIRQDAMKACFVDVHSPQ